MNHFVQPGTTVVTDFGYFDHFSIVSDQLGSDGWPMLISSSRRNGLVKEEPWTVVTQGRRTYVADIKGELPGLEVVRRARGKVNGLSYRLTNRNCENFVRWANGLPSASRQVAGGLAGTSVGAILAKNLGVKMGPAILITLATGLLGIAASKARKSVRLS